MKSLAIAMEHRTWNIEETGIKSPAEEPPLRRQGRFWATSQDATERWAKIILTLGSRLMTNLTLDSIVLDCGESGKDRS